MKLEDLMYGTILNIIFILEIMGIIIICISAIKAFYKYIKNTANKDKNRIKIEFAEAVALALEFKLASEIVRTVIIKSMKDLYILGAVITLRIVLTVVTQWEIEKDSGKKAKN